ncbi:LysR substrate-binding domain-containing protein (plasmid) [Pseudoalteromonas espejiana]
MAEFGTKYTQKCVIRQLHHQVVNIMDEGLDLSIRVGWLADSSLMARKIGESKRLLVASSTYAKKHKIPEHPNDLRQDWVHFSMRGATVDFTSPNGEVVYFRKSRINVNSALAISHFISGELGSRHFARKPSKKAISTRRAYPHFT